MKKVLSALLLMLIMASCNKQEFYEKSNILVVYINSVQITRAALTTDPKLVENTINTLTIGVFSSDGTVKTVRDFSNIGTAKSVSMNVLNLSSTDKVRCSINTRSGLFADVKNINDFNNKEISLDDAISNNKADLVGNNLPMYGESPIALNGDTYIANIDAFHLNSKITLNSLTMNIPNNGTFTQREIFVMNSPSSMKASYNNPYTNASYFCGALNCQITGEAQKQYLGYGNINSPVKQLFFYTSPNNSEKYTKLVICGMYDADGSNGPIQQKMTYYPIVIDKNLLPNRNYIITITLKGLGVDDPNTELNYSNLKVNINVQNFTDINKDVQLE